MKNKKLIEELQQLPEDFEVCLSAYFLVKPEQLEGLPTSPEEAEEMEMEEEEDLHIVFDHPIIGIAVNEDSEEIRFVLRGSSQEAIETVDGGMSPLESAEDDIDLDLIAEQLEDRESVLIGSMYNLWGHDPDAIMEGLQELAVKAKEKGVQITSGGKEHRHLVYARKL